jgi:hypothetical protein
MSGLVILEVIYPYPVERVWRALTDSRALAKWLLPNDFEPRLGHKFSFVREHPGAVSRPVEKCSKSRSKSAQSDQAGGHDYSSVGSVCR